MIRTKLARRVLTRAEQRHLTDVGIRSLAGLREAREYQRALAGKDGREPCYECRTIARKLGLD